MTPDDRQIAEWLARIGLGQYVELFRDHDIDMDVVGELSEEELKEIGLPLGARKRLARALGEPRDTGPSPPPAPATEAEKRFLTLMFADLADSTAIASRIDIEDMHELNRRYQIACAEAIRSHDGFLARYMGDGILAYFGYPSAREDDAQRAVLAGLEIVERIDRLNAELDLPEDIRAAVRVGLASGPVVVETIGDGATTENAVVGEAPNLAARMQGLAAANTVVIGPDTRRLVAGAFELHSIGEQPIKGYPDPMEVWRVSRVLPPDQRDSGSDRRGAAPMVGRQEELGMLTSRWQRARDGEGQVVLLSGEGGIGKSRLVDAFLEQAGQGHRLVRYYGSASHSQQPLYPYIAGLMREAGVSTGDDDLEQFRKLEALLVNQYGLDRRHLETLAALIPLEVPSEDGTPVADPRHQLQQLQEALAQLAVDISREAPLLLVVEDAHWIDASSRSVIDLVAERIAPHPVLLLVTFRSEDPVRVAFPHVTSVTLANLSRDESEQLIEHLAAKHGLGRDTVSRIREKSAGIPLFLEEVTSSVISERGAGVADGVDRVPDTLQASLLSRLDRLGDAKQVAQCAAVIGISFARNALSEVTGQAEAMLESGIDRLVTQDITVRQSGGEDAKFRFRHALLRDAAYETLLKKQRQEIHARIATYLATAMNLAGAVNQPEIAYHFEMALQFEQAFGYWLKSGQQALDSGATAEAVELLERAYALREHVPENAETQLDMFALHMYRGRALNAYRGAVAEDAHESFRQAVAIASRMGSIEREVDALDYLFGITFNAGRLRESLEPAERMLKIGLDNDHLAATISGHQVLGMAYCVLGEFTQAKHHLESALDTRGQSVTGINCYPSMTQDYLSFVRFFLGDYAGAEALCREAIDSGRQESDYATASALSNSCLTQMMLGNYEEVRRYSEEVIDLANERGLFMYLSRGQLFNNLAIANLEADRDCLTRIVDATDRLYESREYIELTCLIGLTAELQLKLGLDTEAAQSLERALALADRNEEHFYKAELLRLKALLEGCPADQALALATEQQATGWIDRIRERAG